MRFEESPGGNIGAHTEDALTSHTGGRKIDILDNVVQRDMRVKTRGSRERRRREPGEGRERIFGGGETGEDKIEPNHVRVQPENGFQQAHRRGYTAKLPATNDFEARPF